METVRVSASREYDVFIGSGFLDSVGEMLLKIKKPCKVVIVSDDTVFSLYGERVIAISNHIRSHLINNYVIDNSFSLEYGARPVKRFIQREIETLLAKAIIRGDIIIFLLG